MSKRLTQEQVTNFYHTIWTYYAKNRRSFVWRNDPTPYKVFVSEIMLQQTQTKRVIPKFENWMELFPDITSLAQAPRAQVLLAWQGLGYNSRAIRMHEAAKIIVEKYAAVIPDDQKILDTLPGIGINTAGSIAAFAYQKRVVFIETNIRTIFLYEFFKNETMVSDALVLELIEQVLPNENIRDWYYALMDYGVHLKQEFKAHNKRSKHYTRQSRFQGSQRQVRGAIVRLLTKQKGPVSIDYIQDVMLLEIPDNQHSVTDILQRLVDEKVVCHKDEFYFL